MLRFFISYLTFLMRRRLPKKVVYKSDLAATKDLLEMRNVLLQGIVHYSNLIKLIDTELEDLSFEMEADEKWKEAVRRSHENR